MAAVIYRCPTTGLKVQGWFPEDVSTGADRGLYLGTVCIACTRTHLVNPCTGKVIGGDEHPRLPPD